ncbi:LysR family transcriptional regulator [Cohnella sp. WQ 127256]|uniref:LysR family transcriptional regulator n=1 Tax=Cohnella sp. WQ 127256 TaxID=2938790 RepID=UPI0021195099|nr:LysR family transcriptional regulator [Cohnella sp. WQ 127256]
MQIRLLQTFQTIVRLGSFHRAAVALKYSQPTVTVHLQKLESELGIKLIERGKTIKLTREGQLVYERADALLKEYWEFSSTLEDMVRGETGIIHIGSAEPSASRLVPSIVAAFLETKPKAQITITVGTNQELMQLVLNDQIDFALCHQPEPDLYARCERPDPSMEIEFHPLQFERFTLLIPSKHRLAHQNNIQFSDLHNERLLVTPESCPFRLRLESMMDRKAGVSFKNKIEVGSITAVKNYVQAGLGITFVPSIDSHPLLDGTMAKEVEDIENGPQLGILAKRGSIVSGTLNATLFEEFQKQLLMDM